MENRKDIGKAINEKLSSLDKTPRDQVWNGIRYELEKKKKRRIGFFFFWAKIVGLILVGSISTLYVYDHYYNESKLFPTESSKDRITIDNVNGESVTITPNSKTTDIQNNEINNNTKNGNAANGKNGSDEIETNNGKSNDINNENNVNSADNYSKTNAANSKNGNVSAKSSLKGNINSIRSKSGKSKPKLFPKFSTTKAERKSSKKGRKNSKPGRASGTNSIALSKKDRQLTGLSESNPNAKKTSSLIDLSSLENKKPTSKTSASKVSKKDSIIAQRQKEKEIKIKVRDSLISQKQKEKELQAKTKDSLIAQKQKDKVINIKMYPKDSIKTDSALVYRKIQVDAFVSPTLYGYSSNASTLDSRLDSLPKRSEIKFSYGFGITYDLTKRLSVRVGYRKINLSYITKNAPINADNYNGIAYEPAISNQTILTAFHAISGENTYPEIMDITQKISYTEIPLEVKYKFVDKKIGLKSSIGFSYLLLGDNTISIKTFNGFSQDIGKTKNLSSTSFSVNFGFEADYPLFKNTKIFVEPLFNYQLKAFSDGNYKPYVFGIHTGIRYSFNTK